MDNTSFNNDTHLTYEELVAYSQGNLSNKEMHRLELHLISCELCNDALDGVANIEEVKLYESLISIKSRTEIKSSKSISISRKQWLAMAASVALIAVVSVIVLLVPHAQDATIAEEQPIEQETLVADNLSKENIEDEDSIYDIAQQEDSLLALATAPTPQYATRKVQANEVAEEEAKGLSVSDLPTNNADVTMANDTAFLAENIALNITEDEIESEEDNDVATRAKKIAAPAAGLEPAASRQVALSVEAKSEESGNYKAAEPEKGIKSYNRYLKRNLKYPVAARENNISGDVILQLTINSFGSITNINVVQSLGYGCDQEAIRLIREGPKWLPGQQNNSAIVDKATVTVPFKL